MKNLHSWIFIGLFLAVSQWASASTMPLNHLNLQDNPRVLYNVSPVMFRKLIDQVVGTFSPIVRSHGAELKVNYYWENSTVNAYAHRDGNRWYLNMFGGLARRKEITPDGFSLVVCHELGHHLAGYPFKGASNESYSWAADEGQSDYFAAQVCARAIWGRDFQANAVHRYTVDPVAKQFCDRAYQYQPQRDLCYRIADAGQSLANLLNQLEDGKREPAYRKATNAVRVPRTFHDHPAAQCRLETYLNGATCKRSFDVRTIPGYDIQMTGGSPLDQEKEAAKYSCGERGSVYDGSRPRCWFQPQLPNWF